MRATGSCDPASLSGDLSLPGSSPAAAAEALAESWSFLEPQLDAAPGGGSLAAAAGGRQGDPGFASTGALLTANPFDVSALEVCGGSDILVSILSNYFHVDKLTVLATLLSTISNLVVCRGTGTAADSDPPVWVWACPTNAERSFLMSEATLAATAQTSAVHSAVGDAERVVPPLHVIVAQPGGARGGDPGPVGAGAGLLQSMNWAAMSALSALEARIHEDHDSLADGHAPVDGPGKYDHWHGSDTSTRLQVGTRRGQCQCHASVMWGGARAGQWGFALFELEPQCDPTQGTTGIARQIATLAGQCGQLSFKFKLKFKLPA